MRAIGLGVIAVLGGCDAVFGLSGDPGPCDTTSFASVTPRDLVAAEEASVSWDRTRAVIYQSGMPFEVELADGVPQPIALDLYVGISVALAPEGTSMFFTDAVEPPVLRGALRAGAATWDVVSAVPMGTFAGTPTAEEFGPRRLLVRLRQAFADVQEYELDDGVWKPHGTTHAIDGAFAPNLTPNGLSMVYEAIDPMTGANAVFLATRGSVDDWFGDPVVILAGEHRTPQLLDACKALYSVDDATTLREYDQP